MQIHWECNMVGSIVTASMFKSLILERTLSESACLVLKRYTLKCLALTLMLELIARAKKTHKKCLVLQDLPLMKKKMQLMLT